MSSLDVVGLADGEHHRDPLRLQPPRHERKRLRRGPIEPLRIVDEAHERSRSAASASRLRTARATRKLFGGSASLQPERHTQRIPLRTGQPVQPVEHRRAQLMQPRERELHLRLNTRNPDDPTPQRPLGHVLQKRRLADPRLAAHHQHRALP